MIDRRRSFRGELLIVLVLSLLFAALTEGSIIGVVYLLFRLSSQNMKDSSVKPPKDEPPSFFNSFEYRKMSMRGDSTPYFDGYIRNYIIGILFIIIIIGVILFIFYFMLLTRKFSHYINEITSGIQEISIGNFEHKILVETGSELGLVAEKMNEMSNSIYTFLCEERQNEDVKNELITSVAHDIRTPLTSIIGYLYLLVNRKDLDAEVKERYIQVAYDKSKRLEQLTEDLFSYTKYSTDEVKMHYEKIDLVKFMEQMVDEFYPSFKEAQLTYDFKCEMDEAYILADGNTLARAIGNLVSNAIKYGRDGKYINITLKKEGDFVSVSVLNYGAVIPKEKLNHIFERFYRVDNSRSEQTGGSGLGLAIAKSIIEKQGGSIEVRSDFEGTVFEVKLKIYNDEEDLHEG